MLTALYEGKTLYVDDYEPEFLKKISEEKSLFCPDCGDALIFREGGQKRNHFSHLRSDCSNLFSEAESIEHETGKKAILNWLKTQFIESDCFVEKKIKETNQRSDTYVQSIHAAFEFQCSPIQAKTWTNRHELYQIAGVKDLWILGYSMHKYYADGSTFAHKLNSLEEELLSQYGKLIYYDVLTKQFIFLYPEKKLQRYLIGKEYFFKPDEVITRDHKIFPKFEYFIDTQRKRQTFALQEGAKAKETSEFIKETKKTVEGKKILASSKQISYIKFLLFQLNRKTPYKFHGLLMAEADAIIKKLKEELVEQPLAN